ncbi:alpha/beta fold hydrolase [Parasalinivibrio latis]|uniref:alpha/beta fold hydrolase n=1 Tax=Parasalinivibrio latis TaxID=2952610 RepID=UPI0030E0E7F7
MPNTELTLYTREDGYQERMDGKIAEFWQQRQDGWFPAKDGLQLYWCAFTRPENDKAVVVVNGRIESVVKYQELFYELYQQGYDVYSYDHRGQGYSNRLVTEPKDIGHVVWFDDYIDDLDTFMQGVVMSKHHTQRYMLAHSMGGAIASLYAEQNGHCLNGLALSAPMHGIHLSPWMKHIAAPVSRIVAAINHPARYALGQGPYEGTPFADNNLSQSLPRYTWFRNLYMKEPVIKVGGPSNRWVWQGLQAGRRCVEGAAKARCPVLLIQAGKDKVVSNEAQWQYFRRRQQAGQPVSLEVVENARHEALFEMDEMRDQALLATLRFFASHL